ncbi:MAG TPA: two-component regulator propeller domain-containing protein, partial [Prolixibacteraceae bacterium]|nr:two-component regulator propeller domain-containing protein [Prolixibacteraceae bacterium]
MRRFVRKLVFVLLAILSAYGSYSSGYSFERLNRPLSHSNILTICQDEQGFMWFGSRNGLNRYDGVNIVNFHHQGFDSTSLINNLVNVIRVCHDSLLWIGTYEGLSLFDPHQFTFSSIRKEINLNFDPDFGNVLSIDTGRNGEIWMGTIANGAYCFNKAKGEWNQYRAERSSGGICSDLVNAVKCDKKGRVWIGTRNGLSVLENNGNIVTNYHPNPNDPSSLSEEYINAFAEDSDGTMWIATVNMGLQKAVEENGRIRFERVAFYRDYYNYNPGFSILSLLIDRSGNLWIGTENGGVYVRDARSGIFTRYMNDPFDPLSIAGNSIYTIYQSDDGIIWIGTYNQGVCFYDPNKLKFEHFFQNPTRSNLLNCNIVKYIRSVDHHLIIGTDGGGLTLIDQTRNTKEHFTRDARRNSIGSNTVMCMWPDFPDGIWLGTWDAGMDYFNRETKQFRHYSMLYDRDQQQTVEHVTAFHKDQNKRLWIGTFGFGLNYYSPADDRMVHFSGRDAGNSAFDTENIHCITETSDGEMYFGTMDGLYRLNDPYGNPKITRYQYQSHDSLSLSNNLVVTVFEDKNGQIWVGTIGGGLNLFDRSSEKFRRFGEKEGLPENTIRSIFSDTQNRIWISTNLGIARLNPDDLSIKAFRSNVIQNVGEFLHGSVTIDAEGFLYFGGSNGFIRFHPDAIVENPHIPKVYFSDFRLFNQPVKVNGRKSPLKQHISSTSEIELNYNQSVLSIDFVALNYTEPNLNNYAYYLEGFEPGWNYAGQNKTATYTNLNPGKYTFKVKASNNNGIWNPEPAQLLIKVKAPGWANWWAFSGYIFILSFIFFLVLKMYKDRAVEKEQIRTERIQHLHIQELKDRKLQFFTNLSHEIRTPLSLIISPLEEVLDAPGMKEEIRKKIRYAANNSRFLLKLVNQLLDIRKLDNQKMELLLSRVDLNELATQIINLHSLRADEKQIELILEPLTSEKEFYVDVDKIEKILHNLLSNAVKFSPEKSLVIVRLSDKKFPGMLTMEVIDHGPGIEPDQIPLIFERFYQGKLALNRGGTGIGLAL